MSLGDGVFFFLPFNLLFGSPRTIHTYSEKRNTDLLSGRPQVPGGEKKAARREGERERSRREIEERERKREREVDEIFPRKKKLKQHFNIVANALASVLAELNVPKQETDDVMALVGSLEPDFKKIAKDRAMIEAVNE